MSDNNKYKRSINLTDDVIEQVVGILDGWTGKIGWDSFIDEIEFRIKNRYTRQALSKHKRIKDAFDLTKKRGYGKEYENEPASVEVSLLIQKLKRAEAENERLHMENEELLTQFARWAYNAYSKGVTKETLDKPLSVVDRGKTKIG
jgi:hypothetical protein